MNEQHPLLDMEQRGGEYGSILAHKDANTDLEKNSTQIDHVSTPHITRSNTLVYKLAITLFGTYEQRQAQLRAKQPFPLRLAPSIRNDSLILSLPLDHTSPSLLSDQLVGHFFRNFWIHDQAFHMTIHGYPTSENTEEGKKQVELFKKQQYYESYGRNVYLTLFIGLLGPTGLLLLAYLFFISGWAPMFADAMWGVVDSLHVEGTIREALGLFGATVLSFGTVGPVSFLLWNVQVFLAKRVAY